HLEHYGGDFGQVVAAFRTYLTRVPPDGLAVLGGDNPVLRSMADGLTVPRALYGLDPAFDVWADDLAPDAGGTRFRVHAFGAPPLTARLPVPGVHNVVDALGAVTAAAHAGVAPAAALEALAGFRNARRRLEVHYRGIVTIIDDYAHHPTEIRATIAACRQLTTGTGRLLVAFQPQRYRRTRNLWEGFAAAFPEADAVYLTEIYAPPGETPLPGVEGRRLAQAVAAASGVPVRFLPDPAAVAEAALAELRPGDTFLTMGAGDIYRAAERLAAAYRAAPAGRAGSG
ncbi:MAG: Mur ligase family protein, partial [Firmicutes bacterium]|nr:Mur ligase family protein [Bacillota bacterium]